MINQTLLCIHPLNLLNTQMDILLQSTLALRAPRYYGHLLIIFDRG